MLTRQQGNSHTLNQSSDDTQTAQATEGLSKMVSAAKDYAKRHSISEQQAWSEMETKSRSLEADGSVSLSSSKSLPGKLASASLGLEGKASVKGSANTGSQSAADQRETGSLDHTLSEDVKNAQDFKTGKQTVQSYRVSQSAVQNDNQSASQLEQIGTTLGVADSQYQQYTQSHNRSHEYSNMASLSESETAAQNSNLSQEFVEYVRQHNPQQAQQLLTDTQNEDIRDRRERLANAFVEEKLRERVKYTMSDATRALPQGMQPVSAQPNMTQETLLTGSQIMNEKSEQAGIKADTRDEVIVQSHQHQEALQEIQESLTPQRDTLEQKEADFNAQYQDANSGFVENYGKAAEHQNSPLDRENNPGDIEEQARKLMGEKINGDKK